MIQALKLDEAGFAARASTHGTARCAATTTSSTSAARRRARHPSRLFPRRRRHRRDQHVLLDADRAGRLRHAGGRLRAQLRGRAARARGRGMHRRAGGRPAPLRRRRHRPDQPHRLDLARRQQSGLPRRHLRRGARGLWRAGPRPGRRRRRPPADRDDLRHAQRQGGALRHRRAGRGTRRARSRDDFRHHHRSLRAAAVGPDHGGVLAFGPPRGAALDRAQLRARRERDARPHRRDRRASPIRWCAPIPMPGCPTSSGSTTRARTPWPACSANSPHAGLVNIVGGCCGTTPAHIRAIAAAVAGKTPRADARDCRATCGSPVSSRSRSRRKSRSSMSASAPTSPARPSSASWSPPATMPAALAIARDQVENGAQIIDVNMDEGLLDSEKAMDDVPQSDRRRARHRPRAGDGRFLEVRRHRGRPEMRAGQGGRQLDLDEGGRGGVHPPGQDRAPPRRRRRRHGVRREGPGRHARAQGRDLRARLRHPGEPGRLPARGHHLRSQHLRRRHRHRGARRLRRRLHRGGAADPREACRTCTSRAASPTCRSRSAATSRCARRCTRCSSIMPSRPAWTWASSMPGRSRSTTISIRSCARRARTWCSTAARTRPSGCWRSPSASAGQGHERKEADLAWREWPVDKRLAHALVHGITDFIADDVEEARLEGRPAAVGDRGAADGRHERRRRPVRLGQDVPAAGGQVGARDEAGGRLPDAVHGAGEAGERQGPAPPQRQDRDGDRQGRRARHRQEHRRRRAPVQQLRGDRSRRHGAGGEDPGDRARREGRHHRPVRPDHALARRDVPRGGRDGARRASTCRC